ncbi:hypothetical protein [Amycolatopsis panacis]|uniref:Dihydrodipicolinate synthase family protein n=1 Tax=Amycolatopsis panacis TaxID=2340917 RepID=A0A419I488_9PSEU|nr:hypothetical protein [Amycolatopsis panacis]RJQ85108.1 hypothetical protein D5S19_15050 [Amycolatopsis panacis]
MSRAVPALTRGLFDDAAIFPPGLAPLPEAVAAHDRHAGAWYAEMVGPLVVSAAALDDLGPVLIGRTTPLPIVVTLPAGPDGIPGALAKAAELPVTVTALEVAVPPGFDVSTLRSAVDNCSVPVAVEIPRDDRRIPFLQALSGTPHRAKFRTGGTSAEYYPDEAELASAVREAAKAGVAFKATAGLHYAIRNTDAETGFEQHGFLNLLLATEAVARTAPEEEVVALLAERDGKAIATRIRRLAPDRLALARERFTSFGTCSITDPLTDLTDLGLIGVPA